MVETSSVNGTTDVAVELPDVVVVSIAEMQQFPSPGTQRALKAKLAGTTSPSSGPTADSADRTQTQIWTHLRKTIPNLRWGDCAEISLQIADADAALVDPTQLSSSVPSPDSVGSGG